MRSGIFAVANIGGYRLYVGEVHQIQMRWPLLMIQLQQGRYPHVQLLQAWRDCSQQRRFSFHTARELTGDRQIMGYEQFLHDTAYRPRYEI